MSGRRSGQSVAVAALVVATSWMLLAASAEGASPSPSSAPGSSPDAASGPGRLGANEEIYRDDFSSPSGWTIIDDESGRTAYEGGGLAMSATQDGSTLWDDHQLPEAHAVLRVEALVSDLIGSGAAGVACGSSLGLPRYLFASVTGEAEWVFGRIIDGRVQVLKRAPLPGDVDEAQVRVGIECASVPAEGGDRVLVTLDGVGVQLPTLDIPVGAYDKATLVMSADDAPVSAVFDDLLVHAGDVYARDDPDRDPTKPSV